MTKLISGMLLAVAIITGCIFESKDSRVSYSAGHRGEIGPVHTYDVSGAPGTSLGLGVETSVSASDWLSFWPDVSWSTTGFQNELVNPDPWNYSHPVAYIARDTTYLIRFEPGILLPNPVDTVPLAGAPCVFSEPRGFQFGPGGETDTVPLIMSGIRLTLNVDSLRFAMLIDTAASKAADARVDFSRTEFEGTVRISCPES